MERGGDDGRSDSRTRVGWAAASDSGHLPGADRFRVLLVHGLLLGGREAGGGIVSAKGRAADAAPRRVRGHRGVEGRLDLVPRGRHPASPEPVAHGWDREPSGRDRGLPPHVPADRWDPAGPPMAAPTQRPRGGEAHEGAAGGLRAPLVEAVRVRNGAGLPPATTEGTMRRLHHREPTVASPGRTPPDGRPGTAHRRRTWTFLR